MKEADFNWLPNLMGDLRGDLDFSLGCFSLEFGDLMLDANDKNDFEVDVSFGNS